MSRHRSTRPIPDRRPHPLVVTLPAELDAASSIALVVTAVHPSPDGDETEFARVVIAELDEARRHQIDGFPVIQKPVTVCRGGNTSPSELADDEADRRESFEPDEHGQV